MMVENDLPDVELSLSKILDGYPLLYDLAERSKPVAIETVGQLKKSLEKYSDDTPVLRGDNSGGYENIYRIEEEKCYRTNNPNESLIAIVLD
jgi:hypothetical protein